MKHFRRLSLICTAAVLAACGGGGGGGGAQAPSPAPAPPPPTPAQQVAAIEAAGAIPKLDRSASLLGTDTNANGVRDDIDTHLVARLPDASQRAAATQVASALQATLSVNLNDQQAVKAVAQRSARALNCLYTRLGSNASVGLKPAAIAQEIQAITVNTKTRLLAYEAYNGALSGTVFVLPEGDTCD